MATIKLTAKRQATFPAEVCKELGVESGDSLEITPLHHGNQIVWVLKAMVKTKPKWMGALKQYAKNAKKPWTREEHGEATARAMARDSAK